MAMNGIFMPFAVATTAVAVSGSSAAGALNLPTNQGSTSVVTPPGDVTVRVYNATTVTVFIKFGTASTVTAATTDMPIPAGGVEVFAVGAATYIAGITAGTSGTLYASPGFGF